MTHQTVRRLVAQGLAAMSATGEWELTAKGRLLIEEWRALEELAARDDEPFPHGMNGDGRAGRHVEIT